MGERRYGAVMGDARNGARETEQEDGAVRWGREKGIRDVNFLQSDVGN